jgi:hypothetical protein
VVVTTWEITVKLIFALLVASMPLVANAWGVAGLPAYVGYSTNPQEEQQRQYQQQQIAEMQEQTRIMRQQMIQQQIESNRQQCRARGYEC